MKILIAYATYSGSTLAASEFLSQELNKTNNQASLKMISEVSFKELSNYDLIIFASPSWDYEGKEGQPHQDFIFWMEQNKNKKINGKNFAVMGLGDSSYPHFCGAVEIIEDFIKSIYGVLKTDSLKIDGYLFDTDKNNKLISSWAKKLNS